MRRYYKRKYERLKKAELEKEIIENRRLYDENFKKLMDALKRGDTKKHLEYCKVESALEAKSIRLVTEAQIRNREQGGCYDAQDRRKGPHEGAVREKPRQADKRVGILSPLPYAQAHTAYLGIAQRGVRHTVYSGASGRWNGYKQVHI
jgi:hypothetical protein